MDISARNWVGSAMKTLLLRYCAAVAVVAWWFSRHLAPALITLGGLIIIAGSTMWLMISIVKEPKGFEKKEKSWWRLILDAFWGL